MFKSTTQARPYVSGKRIVLASRSGRPIVLGTFSCHLAAVVALVRLYHTNYCPPSQSDLARAFDRENEEKVRDKLIELYGIDERQTTLQRHLGTQP